MVRWYLALSLALVARSAFAGQASTGVVPIRETVMVPPGDHESLVAAPLSSATSSAEDLQALGPDARLWLEAAMATAGAFVGQRQLYVDGMPATSAPAAARVASVAVNVDPFSAEAGGVDRNRIDISTKTPDRRWHFNLDSPSWRRGGSDALAERDGPKTRHLAAGVSGPIRATPLAFFANVNRYTNTDHPAYLAIDPAGTSLSVAPAASTRMSSWSAGTSLDRPELTWTLTARGSANDLQNTGIGGLETPATAFHSSSTSRQLQTTWRASRGTVTHRGGAFVADLSTAATADSPFQARTLLGLVHVQGREWHTQDRDESRWSLRHVVERGAGRRPWSAGGEVSRVDLVDATRFNPLGRLYLDAPDAMTGTLIFRPQSPPISAATTTGALFVQGTPIVNRRRFLRAGVRAEWQSNEGVLLLPRATLLTRGHGFVLGFSGGLFTDAFAPSFYAETMRRGLADLTVVHDAAIADLPPLDLGRGDALSFRLSPTLARRRDAVLQVSVTRRLGKLDAGIEHKWTRGSELAGAIRTRTLAGLEDAIDSDRRLRRHQLHARAGFSARNTTVTGHYEHVRSHDDTDEPFSLPSQRGDIGGEWGRSTGIPRHFGSLTASATLPRDLRLYLTATAASGSPYSLITGRDADGLATFTDRGGAIRNGATTPVSSNLSFYASHRLRIPHTRLVADAGVRLENLFDRLNVLAAGPIAGTAWVGRPLSATPGRSASFWFTFVQ